jgi:hypothetical protein
MYTQVMHRPSLLALLSPLTSPHHQSNQQQTQHKYKQIAKNKNCDDLCFEKVWHKKNWSSIF